MSRKTKTTNKKRLECICPRCGKEYLRWIFWTGNGKPRKYCHECKDILTSNSYSSEYNLLLSESSKIDLNITPIPK